MLYRIFTYFGVGFYPGNWFLRIFMAHEINARINPANDKTNKFASRICQLQTKTYSRRFSIVLVVQVFSSCFFSSSCCCFGPCWCFVATFRCGVASFCCSVATCCCCAATCCCCVATCWCCVAYCWACIAANCCWAAYCCCAAVVVQYGCLCDKIIWS